MPRSEISRPDGAFLAKFTEQLGRFKGDPLAKIELPDSLLQKIDWDPIFRKANVDTDRLVAAVRSKDRLARQKKFAELDAEKAALEKAFDTDVYKVFADERATPAQLTNAMSILLSVAFRPSMAKLYPARAHAEQWQRNIQVAFALAAFEQENGAYPKKLAELAPKYLPTVPDDLFSGKELIYRRSKGGYLMYSVGRNGMDEDGRSYDDEPVGDDLTVRIQRQEK